MDNFTEDEINFLIRLLRGEVWYRPKGSSGEPGVIHIESKVDGFVMGDGYLVKKKAVQALYKMGIIQINPIIEIEMGNIISTHYTGYFEINQQKFKQHPQYQEIIVRVAVGVGPSNERS